ncbi:MAG: signal peptidase I [Candidatus Nitrosopolaris sp.]
MIRKEIKYVIIIVVGITIIFLGIRFAFGEPNPFYVVASGSMIPNLNINDFVIVSHNIPFDSLKVGDTIVFRTYYPNPDTGQHEIIVHRVAEIVTDPDNGQRIIRTKGDANPGSIPQLDYPIFQQNYIGKVVYVIPQLGVITDALRPPTNYILIGLILVVLIYYLRKKNPEAPSASIGGSGGNADNFDSTGTGGVETGATSSTGTGGSGSGVETDSSTGTGGNAVGKEGK